MIYVLTLYLVYLKLKQLDSDHNKMFFFSRLLFFQFPVLLLRPKQLYHPQASYPVPESHYIQSMQENNQHLLLSTIYEKNLRYTSILYPKKRDKHHKMEDDEDLTNRSCSVLVQWNDTTVGQYVHESHLYRMNLYGHITKFHLTQGNQTEECFFPLEKGDFVTGFHYEPSTECKFIVTFHNHLYIVTKQRKIHLYKTIAPFSACQYIHKIKVYEQNSSTMILILQSTVGEFIYLKLTLPLQPSNTHQGIDNFRIRLLVPSSNVIDYELFQKEHLFFLAESTHSDRQMIIYFNMKSISSDCRDLNDNCFRQFHVDNDNIFMYNDKWKKWVDYTSRLIKKEGN